MEKNILNEVNRSREIMGLERLLIEAITKVHKLEDLKNINFESIYKKAMKRLAKSDVANARTNSEGFKELRTLADTKGYRSYNIGKGKKIGFPQILATVIKAVGKLKESVEMILDPGMVVKTSLVQVPTSPGGRLYTYGQVGSYGKYIKETNNKISSTMLFLQWINQYNMLSFAAGDNIFNVSEMIDDKGRIDLVSGPSDDGSNGLLLYSMKVGTENEVSSDYVDKKVEGVKSTGKYGMDWASGEDEPDKTIVKQAVEDILAKFPAEHSDKVTLFKLKAGATANWGEDTTLPDSNGVGENYTTKDNELKNQQLAFSRGNKFMIAVNAGLKSSNHPGFDNYEVSWEVKGQDRADQYIDLMLDLNIPDKYEKIFKGTSEKGDGNEKAGKGNMLQTRVKLG